MTVGSTSLKVKYKDEEEKKHAIAPSTQAFVELIQDKLQDDNTENDVELIQKTKKCIVIIFRRLVSILPHLY